jgi:hypothetical protein
MKKHEAGLHMNRGPLSALHWRRPELPIPNLYAGEHFDRVRNDITARFVTVCCHMEPKEFHILMDQMAREQIRDENAKY